LGWTLFKTAKFNIDKQGHRLESLVEINHSNVTRNEDDIRMGGLSGPFH
jgi:hypothetical protein